jgi:CheY-like chemotaxis protein
MSVRTLTQRVLSRAGYQVLCVSNGDEAITLWGTRSQEVDLLLTDMIMPGGLNGRELAAQLRETRPSLRVVYSSGYNIEWAGPDFGESWASGLLPKPYSPKDLLEAVARMLATE